MTPERAIKLAPTAKTIANEISLQLGFHAPAPAPAHNGPAYIGP